MTFRSAAATLALAAFASVAFAAKDNNPFVIVKDGKNVGNAAFTITKGKDGFHLVGKFQYHISGGAVSNEDIGTKTVNTILNEGQVTEDLKFADDGNFVSGYTQNSTNQIMTSFQPDKAHKIVTINQIQGGVGLGSRDIPLPKPAFLVVPDYDPATMQMLLSTAINHPHDDKLYLLFVPAGSNPKAGNATAYVGIQLAPDTVSGALDGKPVTLKHYLLNYHSSKADLYADDAGNLMEADMGALGVSYVRVNFSMAAAK